MALDLSFLGGLATNLLGPTAGSIVGAAANIGSQFIAGPTPAPSIGVPGAVTMGAIAPSQPLAATTPLIQSMVQPGDDADKMASMRADPVLHAIIHGRALTEIRKLIRTMKTTKQDMLTHLGRIQAVDISSQEGIQPAELSVSDKMVLASVINKIWGSGRRRRGAIPKTVVRFVEKGREIAKLFMHYPRLIQAVSRKKRRTG